MTTVFFHISSLPSPLSTTVLFFNNSSLILTIRFKMNNSNFKYTYEQEERSVRQRSSSVLTTRRPAHLPQPAAGTLITAPAVVAAAANPTRARVSWSPNPSRPDPPSASSLPAQIPPDPLHLRRRKACGLFGSRYRGSLAGAYSLVAWLVYSR
jgi:hypothetical protein